MEEFTPIYFTESDNYSKHYLPFQNKSKPSKISVRKKKKTQNETLTNQKSHQSNQRKPTNYLFSEFPPNQQKKRLKRELNDLFHQIKFLREELYFRQDQINIQKEKYKESKQISVRKHYLDIDLSSEIVQLQFTSQELAKMQNEIKMLISPKEMSVLKFELFEHKKEVEKMQHESESYENKLSDLSSTIDEYKQQPKYALYDLLSNRQSQLKSKIRKNKEKNLNLKNEFLDLSRDYQETENVNEIKQLSYELLTLKDKKFKLEHELYSQRVEFEEEMMKFTKKSKPNIRSNKVSIQYPPNSSYSIRQQIRQKHDINIFQEQNYSNPRRKQFFNRINSNSEVHQELTEISDSLSSSNRHHNSNVMINSDDRKETDSDNSLKPPSSQNSSVHQDTLNSSNHSNSSKSEKKQSLKNSNQEQLDSHDKTLNEVEQSNSEKEEQLHLSSNINISNHEKELSDQQEHLSNNDDFTKDSSFNNNQSNEVIENVRNNDSDISQEKKPDSHSFDKNDNNEFNSDNGEIDQTNVNSKSNDGSFFEDDFNSSKSEKADLNDNSGNDNEEKEESHLVNSDNEKNDSLDQVLSENSEPSQIVNENKNSFDDIDFDI